MTTSPPPDRPDHPDMMLLSAAVQDLDAEAEAMARPFEEMLAALVDPESAVYMARQRALRMQRRGGVTSVELATLMSMFVDGLGLGIALERRRTTHPGEPR